MPEMIHQRRHVGGELGQPGRNRQIAEPVAPAVRRNDGQLQLLAGIMADGEFQARARRPVQKEQRRTRGVAVDLEPERTAVAELEDLVGRRRPHSKRALEQHGRLDG